MPTGTKLHQCLTSCESVYADLQSFVLETENPQAKQLYQRLANDMQGITTQLRARVNEVEREEPQYRVREQAMNPQQKNR